MGFGDPRAFNEALFAKQGLRILSWLELLRLNISPMTIFYTQNKATV
jgi:hypothetical protein